MTSNATFSSYSQWALCKVMTSDWLYPSNKKLTPIEDKGSILESVSDRNMLFNAEDKNSIVHTLGKPVRALLRSITLIFASIIVAPIGVVAHLRPLYRAWQAYWNSPKAPDWDQRFHNLIQARSLNIERYGTPKAPETRFDPFNQPFSKRAVAKAKAAEAMRKSNAAQKLRRAHQQANTVAVTPVKVELTFLEKDALIEAETLKVKRQIESEKRRDPTTQSWQALTDCAAAVAADAGCACTAVLIPYALYRISKVPAAMRWSVINCEEWRNSRVALGASIAFFAIGCFPEMFLAWSVLNNDRASLYKTIELRHQFGLVNQKGGLLEFDTSKDDEDVVNGRPVGHFNEIRAAQAYDLMILIRNTQNLLDHPIPKHYPPCEKTVLEHLEKVKNQKGITHEQYKALVDQFKTLFRNFQKINSLFYDCIDLKYDNGDGSGRKFQRQFPFTEEFCAQFFIAPLKEQAQSDITQAVKDAKAAFSGMENDILKESALSLYEAIRDAVRTGVNQGEMYKILGLDGWPETLQEFNAQYKKCALVLHPDKYNTADPSLMKEAEALFKCCSAVHSYGIQEKYKTQIGKPQEPRLPTGPLPITN